MINFSILIPSYGERERLFKLVKTILEDELESYVDRIVVVSPDKHLSLPRSRKIFLIREEKRKGKYFAIRLGLKKIRTKIVVMLSSDLRMRKNFLHFLVKSFKNSRIGMVVGRPIADKTSKIYSFSKIIWDLHHLLCLKEPKGTEICTFRKIFNYFPKVSANEVFIEYKIRKAGYNLFYEPRAFGYTKIPESFSTFFEQRKRIYCGHLYLKHKYNFTTASFKLFLPLLIALNFLLRTKEPKEILFLFVVMILEAFARLSALFEYYVLKKEYIIWKK